MKAKTLFYLIKSALEQDKELIVELNNKQFKVWGIRATIDKIVIQAKEEEE